MPDFIYARGTFYPVTMTGEHQYFSEGEDEVFSFLIQDYPETLHIDGLTICCQASDVAVEKKFREWLDSD